MADTHVALKDGNSVASAIFESSTSAGTILRGQIDEITGGILVNIVGGGASGTNYNVSGTIDGSNVTFTIPVAVTSDFSLFLARQPQAPTTDYTYVAGVSSTTITMTSAPDASLSGQPFWAFVVA